MEFIADYGSFLLKTVTLVVAILVVVGGMIALGSRQKKSGSEGELKIHKLNEQLEDYKEQLESEINTEATLKHLEKERKKEEKAKLTREIKVA